MSAVKVDDRAARLLDSSTFDPKGPTRVLAQAPDDGRSHVVLVCVPVGDGALVQLQGAEREWAETRREGFRRYTVQLNQASDRWGEGALPRVLLPR